MHNSIKVLHIVSNLSIKSGVASVIISYFRNINSELVNSSILYFDDVEGETYIDELKNHGVKLYYINRNHFYKEWKKFCSTHNKQFDILHNHQSFLTPLFISAKRKLGVKIILTHAHATKFSESFIKSLRNRLLSFPSRFISDKLLACSKEAGYAIFGTAFQRKSFIVKNAIDLRKFTVNLEVRNKLRKSMMLENKYVIGHVGNMTPVKNHKFILSVFSSLLKINKNAFLVLIGGGYLREKIEKEILELGLGESVILLGVVNNVHEYLNAFDVFLYPSLFEGLGIAIIEAQACGIPCVYSDQVPSETNILYESNVRLSLRESPEKWATQLNDIKKIDFNPVSRIQDAGYDIMEASKLLTDFYYNFFDSI